MASKHSKFKLGKLYKKACNYFLEGNVNFTEIGRKCKVTRQLAAEWHKRWREETFDSDHVPDLYNAILENKPEIKKESIEKAIKGIDLLKAGIPGTLEVLKDNIERAAKKERDPSKISKAFTDLAQFVMETNPPEGNPVNNTYNWFAERFQLNQTVNQIGNGQSKRTPPLRNQEE